MVYDCNVCHNGIFIFSFLSVAGVPYHVRVYAENTNGRGSHCITTDFGDQLSKAVSLKLVSNV